MTTPTDGLDDFFHDIKNELCTGSKEDDFQTESEPVESSSSLVVIKEELEEQETNFGHIAVKPALVHDVVQDVVKNPVSNCHISDPYSSSSNLDGVHSIDHDRRLDSMEHHSKHMQKKRLNKRQTCPTCSKTFRNGSSLKEHIRSVHPGQMIVCDQCDKQFGSKDSLRKHIRAIHEFGPNKRPKCPTCRKKFKNVGNLNLHIRSIHEGRRFVCDQCDKQINRKLSLIRHIAICHNNWKHVRRVQLRDNPESDHQDIPYSQNKYSPKEISVHLLPLDVPHYRPKVRPKVRHEIPETDIEVDVVQVDEPTTEADFVDFNQPITIATRSDIAESGVVESQTRDHSQSRSMKPMCGVLSLKTKPVKVHISPQDTQTPSTKAEGMSKRPLNHFASEPIESSSAWVVIKEESEEHETNFGHIGVKPALVHDVVQDVVKNSVSNCRISDPYSSRSKQDGVHSIDYDKRLDSMEYHFKQRCEICDFAVCDSSRSNRPNILWRETELQRHMDLNHRTVTVNIERMHEKYNQYFKSGDF